LKPSLRPKTMQALSDLYSSIDASFFVTENLNTALPHLKYTQDERVIWIDALCINQDHILESNQQVTVMRDIHQKAIKVIVWLGRQPIIPILRSNFWLRRPRRSFKSRVGCLELLEKSNRFNCWKAFYDLANHDYWKHV
jgi:hypothetical protein